MIDPLTLILFGAGFFFLVRGADALIEGGSSIAKHFGVSTFIIGLTIVAFGTSLPELVVSIFASLEGNGQIIIGNILGSNVANILLILGLMAVATKVFVGRKIARKELPISFLAIAIFIVLANGLLGDPSVLELSREDGVILLAFFSLFMYYVFSITRKGKPKKEIEETVELVEPTTRQKLKPIALIVLGIAGLWLGGDWIINGAVAIATELGISETLIGLTIIAVGTSIPEIAASVVALKKKIADMAVGNIIGSNIFNIFWVVGLSAVINPIPFQFFNNFEAGMVVFATIIMLVFLMMSGKWMGSRYALVRWQGAIMIVAYATFIALTVVRG